MAATQAKKKKKVLGLTDVLGFVFGQIIGAGVLVLTGIGIGLTGKGIVLAFLISGIINVINKNMSNDGFSVEMLAQEVGISRVHMYRKLKVYAGAAHPHTAQQPQELKF